MFIKIYEGIKNFIIKNYKFLIFLAVFFVIFTYELPYVVYTPGGNINLNDRIEIEGKDDSSGSYNMAYVSMYRGTIPALLLSYVIPNWDIDSTDNITLENQSIEELLILDRLQMENSIDIATILAYEENDIPVSNIVEHINVSYIMPEAKTDLEIGDKLISVEGIEELTFDSLTDFILEKEEGDKLVITVERDGKEIKTSSTLSIIEDKLMIGIIFINTYDFDAEPNLEIESKQSESGPSGGLMLSLSIYDKLIDEDLSDGKKIVGTGTISIDGSVGEIDGVKYKLLGSKDAEIFFCPEENYEEAISVKEKFDLEMKIYGVSTFAEAVRILENN